MASILVALAITGLAGCHSGVKPRNPSCEPAPGMTTNALALCGCFSVGGQGGYRAGSAGDRSQIPGRGVIILNYFCPLGPEGIAKVVVVNGVAREVYR